MAINIFLLFFHVFMFIRAFSCLKTAALANAFDCVDHNKLENSERDGNTRPPDLLLEKPVCRLGNNSQNGTWNNRLVPNRKRSTSRLILSPCLFNLYAEYIMRNAGLEEAQAEIKIAGINTNNLRYADDITLMAESEEKLKSLLMKVKEESEKFGFRKLRSWHLVPSLHGK